MRDCLYKLATDEYRGFWAALVKVFLFILSLVYGLIIRSLIFLGRLKPCRLSCRVISVGNITLGGTGKTVLVELIARYLKAQGQKVAILSRGYKKADEPLMLKRRLEGIPVIVDQNRIRGAKKALSEYAVDTVILGDGLQQWRIEKDLEIATIDSTDPFGNRNMLPRGILREPLSSLKRVDMFILTKVNFNPDVEDIKSLLAEINPDAGIFESEHLAAGFYEIKAADKMLSPDAFKGKNATLFCGIADPESFENLIISLGIKIDASFKFPDHHNYTKEGLDKIIRDSKNKKSEIVITTEKDAARLGQLGLEASASEIFVLRIELKFRKDEERFLARLARIYQL